MNKYVIGDRVLIPMDFVYDQADFPITNYNVSVNLLKADKTIGPMTEVPLTKTGTASGTADFVIGQTSLLTEGIYYVRARLTSTIDPTVVATWELIQVNFIKVA